MVVGSRGGGEGGGFIGVAWPRGHVARFFYFRGGSHIPVGFFPDLEWHPWLFLRHQVKLAWTWKKRKEKTARTSFAYPWTCFLWERLGGVARGKEGWLFAEKWRRHFSAELSLRERRKRWEKNPNNCRHFFCAHFFLCVLYFSFSLSILFFFLEEVIGDCPTLPMTFDLGLNVMTFFSMVFFCLRVSFRFFWVREGWEIAM